MGRRHRRIRTPIGGRTAAALLILVVIVAVVAVLTPAVRRELRQSFTQMPTRYTELYFTRLPTVEHDVAVVPVSLVDHGSGSRTYRIQVRLATSDGRFTASTVTNLAPRPGVPTPVVARLPLSSDSAVVHVALLDHRQTLHFRLSARGSPTPGGAP
ncbi:hypothetical protein [Streptomyces sp. V4I2]|uniref:hypothetical protein n=1 Tax=Streptomyces sp. V4I2 TaxID=3042280 RepID=UPI0027803AD5|nr:hypothetical protein [Streptomyces sp. V4I2]MDQ1050198.1 hypothetical protein [Streptomyces sp. V4I2]